MYPYRFLLLLSLCIIPATSLPALARVDTAVLTKTRQIQAYIYNSADLTLIKDTRPLHFTEGPNPIRFSWSGTLIDPTSLSLEIFDPALPLEITQVQFPAGETNQAVWHVTADTSCRAEVVIRYFTSGLSWEPRYTAIVSRDQDRMVPVIISCQPAGMDKEVTYTATVHDREETLTLDARLVLRNFSGQPWPAASVWLDSRSLVTTDILDRETRRIPMSLAGHPEIKKIFHWDGQAMPHDPETLDSPPGVPFGYRITHAPAPGSGAFALPPGNVRLFLEDGRGQTLFAGENFLPLLPAGDSFFLETGRSRDIIIFKRRMKTEKTRIRRNDKGTIQVFDQTVTDRFIVRNTGATSAGIRLTDRIPGQWDPVDMGHAYTLEDHETLVFDIHLDAGETRTFDLTFDMRNLFADKFTQYNKAAQSR